MLSSRELLWPPASRLEIMLPHQKKLKLLIAAQDCPTAGQDRGAVVRSEKMGNRELKEIQYRQIEVDKEMSKRQTQRQRETDRHSPCLITVMAVNPSRSS